MCEWGLISGTCSRQAERQWWAGSPGTLGLGASWPCRQSRIPACSYHSVPAAAGRSLPPSAGTRPGTMMMGTMSGMGPTAPLYQGTEEQCVCLLILPSCLPSDYLGYTEEPQNNTVVNFCALKKLWEWLLLSGVLATRHLYTEERHVSLYRKQG